MTFSTLPSIIVVDDELELVSLYKSFLEKEGYNVVSFSDPWLALEYVKETSSTNSLLITDLRMPGICGIDLARNIREINSDIKIFLMTAFDIRDLELQPNYEEARIDKVLQKPIRFSKLREIIKDVLIV